MKKIIFLVLIISTSQLFSQTYYNVNSVSVVPLNPTSSSNVQILISGDLSGSCSYLYSVTPTVTGSIVDIEIVAQYPPGCTGTSALIPKDTLIDIGVLPVDTYTVTVNGVSYDSTSFVVKNTTISSVNNLSEFEFKVYPNPIIDNIYFDNNEYKCDSYILYDINSRVVSNGMLKKEIQKIDVSHLKSGIFFLVMYREGGKSVFKIQK